MTERRPSEEQQIVRGYTVKLTNESWLFAHEGIDFIDAFGARVAEEIDHGNRSGALTLMQFTHNGADAYEWIAKRDRRTALLAGATGTYTVEYECIGFSQEVIPVDSSEYQERIGRVRKTLGDVFKEVVHDEAEQYDRLLGQFLDRVAIGIVDEEYDSGPRVKRKQY